MEQENIMTMTCTVETSSDTPITDPINTLSPLGETDKHVMQTPQTAYLLTDNNGIVLLETQRGNMFLSVSNDMGGLSYTGISTSPELQGRQLLTTTTPASLLTSVQQDGIVDPQSVGVLLGVQTDVEETLDNTDMSSSSTEQLLGTPDVSSSSAEQLLGATDVITTPTTTESQKSDQKKRGGWPKGKKRKNVPDVNAPKAPMTAYVMFAIQRRQEIKETNPDLPFPEVTKILGNEWSSLDSEKKQKYLYAAQADKKRYVEELKIFQQSEAYLNVMKKKKTKSFSDHNGVDMGLSFTMEDEEEGLNELYCRVCDQYFSSLHNKKEHMFGKQHLQNISGEIQKDIQMQAEQTDTLTSNQLNHDNNQSEVGMSESHDFREERSSPVDVQGFINGFLQENLEREFEIKQLKRHLKLTQEENSMLYKQIQDLKVYQTKLEDEVEHNKAIMSSISSQIDGLKMVNTLFGVINFQV